ncbi:MAG: hypothetical protein D6679_08840 [Candidatus Hydrogenedentota bacterium]|nr:MAG: hypothetical protein D6679_08840 [Candidatus Hydrogenedentota bacterium]
MFLDNSETGKNSLKRLLNRGLPGLTAGLLLALYLPLAAGHVCSHPTAVPTKIMIRAGTILASGGFCLSILWTALLAWLFKAETENMIEAWLPWGAVLLPWGIFLFPEGRYGMTGTPLGPAKHFLSAAWIFGTGTATALLMKHTLRETTRPDAKRLISALFFGVFLLSFAVSTQPPNESDEGDYVAAALGIADHGVPRVDGVTREGKMTEFYFGKIPSSFTWYTFNLERGTPIYLWSKRPFGYPLLLAPFVAVASHVPVPMVRWWIAYLPTLFSYAIGIFFLTKMLVELDLFSLPVFIAVGSMTPFLYYTTNTQPEGLFFAIVPALMFALERIIRTNADPFPGSFLATVTPIFHERLGLVGLPFLIAFFWFSRKRRRVLAGLGLGAVPSFLGLAAIFGFSFPHHLPHAYGLKGVHFWEPTRWVRAIYAHLFSVEIGLFVHLPPWLVLLFPWRRRRIAGESRCRNEERRLVRSFLWISLLYLAVIITYPHTFDSWPHLRYLIPVLPLWIPFWAVKVKVFCGTRRGERIFSLLLGVQLLWDWIFLSVPHLWRWVVFG